MTLRSLLISLRAKLFLWAEGGKIPLFVAAPLSGFFFLGVQLRHFLYDRGWLRSYKVSCPVVSVGNIEAGGTGKTPLVLLLAEAFRHRKVALLTRGYGEVPDEALLLQKRAPFAKVYIGKNRLASAERAIAEGAELIILDDGLQHRRLQRDFELIAVSETEAVLKKNGLFRYLPWGRLRDTPRRLFEADALFAQEFQGEKGVDIALKIAPKKVVEIHSGACLDSMAGKKVALFSAIANPRRFRRVVEEMGGSVLFEKIFADHSVLSEKELCSLGKEAKEKGCELLLCTEKDAVKLSSQKKIPLPLYFLEVAAEVRRGGDFWQKLIAKIEEKIDTSLHVPKSSHLPP